MSKELYFEKAIEWGTKKSTETLKVNQEGYEGPKIYVNQSTNEEVQADMSFISQGGGRHYTDIALKVDNPSDLITRWKLLSEMASMKKGKLHLLVPRGHKSFTSNIVEKHKIKATMHDI